MTLDLPKTLKQRNDLTERLINALSHFPYEQQISIITSFISLDELEDIVRFQEDR